MFSCIEVELKPFKKVIAYAERYGRDWKAEGKPKIIYTSNKIYTNEEIEAIFNGDWSLIKLGPFETKHIRKIRPAITETLAGTDRIAVGLALEAYLRKPSKKVIRAQRVGKKDYSVYVFRLKPEACESPLLLKHQSSKGRKKEAYYVGQTSSPIAERFEQHTNPSNSKYKLGSIVMKKFAFSKEFHVCDCTEQFQKAGIVTMEGLSLFESLAAERELGLYIRNTMNCFSHFN